MNASATPAIRNAKIIPMVTSLRYVTENITHLSRNDVRAAGPSPTSIQKPWKLFACPISVNCSSPGSSQRPSNDPVSGISLSSVEEEAAISVGENTTPRSSRTVSSLGNLLKLKNEASMINLKPTCVL